MPWQVRFSEPTDYKLDQHDVAELDKAKSELHPLIAKEAEAGVKPFTQIKFQPVIGHGIFEAEFAVKDDDIIFHFWPFGYRAKEREGKPQLPRFKTGYEELLLKALHSSFAANRVELVFDKEIGSVFVKAVGYAKSLNPRHLAIQTCQQFYTLSGGTP